MAADVSECSGTQQRVRDGVQQHVGVGMPQQAHRVGNVDTANDQWTTGHQGMGVPAFADAKGWESPDVRGNCLGHG